LRVESLSVIRSVHNKYYILNTQKFTSDCFYWVFLSYPGPPNFVQFDLAMAVTILQETNS